MSPITREEYEKKVEPYPIIKDVNCQKQIKCF